jgi:hypothetical protein
MHMSAKLSLAAAAFATVVATNAAAAPGGGRYNDRYDDRYGGGWSATLCDRPGLRGYCIEVSGDTANLARQNFNDRTVSARFRGRWVVCSDDHYRGICRSFRGEVYEFGPLAGQISSLMPARRGPRER